MPYRGQPLGLAGRSGVCDGVWLMKTLSLWTAGRRVANAGWTGVLAGVFGLAFAAGAFAQNSVPLEGTGEFLPYEVTGLLLTDAGEGSGAVVENPRVVVSCAHVVFDDSIWSVASSWTHENFFHRAWNGVGKPPEENGRRLRGYVKWDTYGAMVYRRGGDSPRAFREDFVVYYNLRDLFDGALPVRASRAIPMLRSWSNKRISGYPGGLYELGDPLEYRLHSTGVFDDALRVESGRYLGIEGPSTGPGNSGGPVWVLEGGDWRLGGVLVSGSERRLGDKVNSIGVLGLDAKANRLFNTAVRLARFATGEPVPQDFTATGAFPREIPDGDRNGVVVRIPANPGGKRVDHVSLSLKISHPMVWEDLQILVRGPGGKTVVVADRPEETDEGVFEISNRRIAGFQNTRAAGEWRVVVRDLLSSDTGQIESVSLSLATR
jgi:hypothetical protein